MVFAGLCRIPEMDGHIEFYGCVFAMILRVTIIGYVVCTPCLRRPVKEALLLNII